MISAEPDKRVRDRARDRCEYCGIPQSGVRLRHVIDHVRARQHGGLSDETNLALCCGRCKLHNGPNLSGVDPTDDAVVPLFHPRTDQWSDHFRYEGANIVGLPPTGRATVAVLGMQLPVRVAARRGMLTRGLVLGPDAE